MWQESLVSESCRPTWRFRLMILGMYYTSNATKPWILAFKMKWLLKKTRAMPQHQNRKAFTYNLWLNYPDLCQMVALAIGRWKTQICLDKKVGISLPNFYERNNQLTVDLQMKSLFKTKSCATNDVYFYNYWLDNPNPNCGAASNKPNERGKITTIRSLLGWKDRNLFESWSPATD